MDVDKSIFELYSLNMNVSKRLYVSREGGGGGGGKEGVCNSTSDPDC